MSDCALQVGFNHICPFFVGLPKSINLKKISFGYLDNVLHIAAVLFLFLSVVYPGTGLMKRCRVITNKTEPTLFKLNRFFTSGFSSVIAKFMVTQSALLKETRGSGGLSFTEKL